jgi:hypothetical protein
VISLIKQFFFHVAPALIKPMRVLWNEVIGFLFLVLGLWTTPATIKAIREFDGGPEALFRITLTGLFAMIMYGFSIGSFLRARRINRS